jgi:hypothetical protein
MAEMPQKISWEKRYSDDSGVQYAVRFDATKANHEDGGPVIEIECIDSVSLPLSMLDWLMDCLKEIDERTRIRSS